MEIPPGEEFLYLLRKYREFLLLLYISLRKKNWESAFSLLPSLKQIENKIEVFLLSVSDKELKTYQIQSIQKYISRIVWIIHKIESQISRLKTRNLITREIFEIKIDFLIKKFLQEKGL